MRIKLSSRNKKILLGILAVVIVAGLFALQKKSQYVNEGAQKSGLVYNGTETVDELLTNDTDLDGALDWEEGLWGTDPTKADTDGDGTSDGVEIAKAKNGTTYTGESSTEEENLTETEKFSRELFATVVTLNQTTGGLDQDTVDQLSASLTQQINQNDTKRVFSYSDIKTTTDNSPQSIQNYKNTMESLFKKSPTLYKNSSAGIVSSIHIIFADVFQTFLSTGNDEAVLSQLDPVIKEIRVVIDGMTKMTVPTGLSVMHLEVLNSFEKVAENLSDLKLIESDPIVAMGAASNYKENSTYLDEMLNKLEIAINQKLNLR